MEDLLFDTLACPDRADALLRKATELSGEVLEHVCSWDVDSVQVCDPTTSGDMMGPDDFDRFSKDHLRELGSMVRRSGKDFVVHMCRNTNDRLDRIAETGCVAFSCDTEVDIRRAVESMRERISIIGNIDPTRVLFSGDPDRVRSETRRILEAGGRCGFLLGAGCDIPVGVPFGTSGRCRTCLWGSDGAVVSSTRYPILCIADSSSEKHDPDRESRLRISPSSGPSFSPPPCIRGGIARHAILSLVDSSLNCRMTILTHLNYYGKIALTSLENR